jgi:hypothetical protein
MILLTGTRIGIVGIRAGDGAPRVGSAREVAPTFRLASDTCENITARQLPRRSEIE